MRRTARLAVVPLAAARALVDRLRTPALAALAIPAADRLPVVSSSAEIAATEDDGFGHEMRQHVTPSSAGTSIGVQCV